MSREQAKPVLRWPVAAAQPVAAPAEKVWEVMSRPGNLELCHPFCEKNPVKVWPGPESRDEVHYLSGWIYERHFRQWVEGVGYDLEIGRPGAAKSTVSWRISAIDPQNCILTIMVYPYLLQNIPVVIRWLPHVLGLRPRLKSYLESVVRGFEWYVTRGDPVPRDQFGKHPWFSAPQSKATRSRAACVAGHERRPAFVAKVSAKSGKS
jgi:hypothetical protein